MDPRTTRPANNSLKTDLEAVASAAARVAAWHAARALWRRAGRARGRLRRQARRAVRPLAAAWLLAIAWILIALGGAKLLGPRIGEAGGLVAIGALHLAAAMVLVASLRRRHRPSNAAIRMPLKERS